MKYWLMKSDVADYSIDDMKRDGKADWTGVRNYQARNFMRDEMNEGDLAFFYHSNADPSGIAGIVKIVSGPKPDMTQFDSRSKYFDSQATMKEPRWILREVAFVQKAPKLICLQDIRNNPRLKKMGILQPGSRLSITPVTEAEWKELQSYF